MWPPCALIWGLSRNYVDFCCRVKTDRYPVMKFIWHLPAIVRFLTLKISCIYHEFVYSYAFSKISTSRGTSVISCQYCFSLSSHTSHVFQNPRSLTKKTNAEVVLTACLFILNISVKQTKCICFVDPISMRHKVPTLSIKFMTVNTVKLFTRTLACTYSFIHRIHQTILSPIYDF